MAKVKTQGTEIYLLDDTDTGNEVRKVGAITGFSGIGGEAGEIDVTDMDSVAREFLAGLKDNGTVSLNFDYDPQDESQQTLDALQGGPNKRFLIALSESDTQPTFATSTYTLPTDRTTFDFNAGVRSFQLDASADDAWRGTMNLRVSGDITKTPAT
jgi:hypothetical protein